MCVYTHVQAIAHKKISDNKWRESVLSVHFMGSRDLILSYDSKYLYLMNYLTTKIFTTFVQIFFQIAQKNNQVGKHPTGANITFIIEW